MNITTTGRKVTLKNRFLEMVEKRMSKFDKYFDRDAEGHVTVTVEGSRQTVEITVNFRGFIYRAERTAHDMEQAFFEAADIIDRQIVRNKGKLGGRIKRTDNQTATVSDFGSAAEEQEFNIAREKRFLVYPMTVDEAILQMNMIGHTFFIFLNVEGEEISVVYKRKDGDYGLITPELA
jgi:putative sigma-54 modulation protein